MLIPPQPSADASAIFLRSLPAVRARAVLLRHPDCLVNFIVDETRLPAVADRVASLVSRDYAGSIADIPPHSRWRHLDAGGVERIAPLAAGWATACTIAGDSREHVRRIIDLFVVSVLLDAGAGDRWRFHAHREPHRSADPIEDRIYTRSEGLAVASIDLFCAGALSSIPAHPSQADAIGLKRLDVHTFATHFQVDPTTNPLVGCEGRVNLLNRLGNLLAGTLQLPNGKTAPCPKYFKPPQTVLDRDPTAPARLGYMVDYILNTVKDGTSSMFVIWEILMEGLAPIWPSAPTTLAGVALGDVWPCAALAAAVAKYGDSDPEVRAPVVDEAQNLAAFHKLSQWIAYSLVEPLEKFLAIKIKDTDFLTGLAEYRNGGLFVDMGVLTLKPEILATARKNPKTGSPIFKPSDDTIVEWRSLTVALIDKTAKLVRDRLNDQTIPLAKILEAGTWKAGREVAAELRPESKGPPIELDSDGTVF